METFSGPEKWVPDPFFRSWKCSWGSYFKKIFPVPVPVPVPVSGPSQCEYTINLELPLTSPVCFAHFKNMIYTFVIINCCPMTCFRELKSVIRNTLSLTSSEYDADVTSLLRSSTALDTTYASDCLQERGLGFYVPETSG